VGLSAPPDSIPTRWPDHPLESGIGIAVVVLGALWLVNFTGLRRTPTASLKTVSP
jgi:hypothetical protein